MKSKLYYTDPKDLYYTDPKESCLLDRFYLTLCDFYQNILEKYLRNNSPGNFFFNFLDQKLVNHINFYKLCNTRISAWPKFTARDNLLAAITP